MAEQLFTGNMISSSKPIAQVIGPKTPEFTPTTNIFENGMTHRVLVAFNRATAWSRPRLALTLLLLAAVGAVVWQTAVSSSVAIGIGLIQLLAMGADSAILIVLGQKQISFGPRKPQQMALAVPRLAATVGLGILAFWVNWTWLFALLVLVQLVATLALYWGAVVEPSELQLTELAITSDRLPSGTPPIRLLHISDIHLERWTRREDQLLAHIEQAQPDLIVITGDYVSTSNNSDPKTLRQVHDLLSQLWAPYGVYATLGTPPVDLRENVVPIFDDLPVTLLREHCVQLDLGKGRQLALLGMDCTHYLPDDIARLARLTAVAPPTMPQLLLNHSPELMPQAAQEGIDLYLCGHTHGGQVRLPIIGPLLTSSQLGRRYVMGHYQEGRTNLYISRGVGFEGLSAPRVRFLTRPEITLVTIHAG